MSRPEPRITRNAIRCLKCNGIAESKHRHDYSSCPCGEVSADGGQAYLRRLWPAGDPAQAFQELAEYESPNGDSTAMSSSGDTADQHP